MKMMLVRLSAALCLTPLAFFSVSAEEVNSGPDVKHFPTSFGYRGQPIPVYAKVNPKTDDLTVASVSLHVGETPEGVTTKIPMTNTRENDHFSATIPPALVGGNDQVWYFLAAYDAATNLTQTRRYPVSILDADPEKRTGEEAAESGSAGPEGEAIPAGATTAIAYRSPATEIGLVAGAAGAVLVTAAALDSGGGGGPQFDESNVIAVPASGSSSGGFSSAPQDRVIDGTSAVAGRQVTGVRVTLNYEAFNVPDRFQIIYEGSVIGDTGTVSGSGTIQAIGNGSSPFVTIRVITDSGGTLWEFTATVE